MSRDLLQQVWLYDGLMAAIKAVNDSTNHHPIRASLRQRASSAPLVFIATHKAPCSAIAKNVAKPIIMVSQSRMPITLSTPKLILLSRKSECDGQIGSF
jgi:hypothetical protein